LSGPASILGEPIPAGVLTAAAELAVPPSPIPAPDILPANLPSAWQNDETTALAIATALSQKQGKTLPWKTVRDVISGSLNRFVELVDSTVKWPVEYHAAQTVRLKLATGKPPLPEPTGSGPPVPPKALVASATMDGPQIQDFADRIDQLLKIKAKS